MNLNLSIKAEILKEFKKLAVAHVTFSRKTYTNGLLFNGLKR